MTSGTAVRRAKASRPPRAASGGKVTASMGMVCYPAAGFQAEVLLSVTESLTHYSHIWGGNLLLKKTGPSLDEARNTLVEHFLNHPECGEYLVFIDQDQVFGSEATAKWLQKAKDHDLKEVSALIPQYDEVRNFIQCPFVIVTELPDNYVETKAMSGGMYALRRDILEELWGRFKGTAFVSAAVGMHEDSMIGQRMKILGVPLVVDLDFRVGHQKMRTLVFPEDWDPRNG